MKMKLIAPSILSADFSNLAQQIRLAEMGGADWIHCDVMDGQFVPNLTFGPIVVEAAKKSTSLPLDVHLMILNPENLVERFAKAGANFITFHYEAAVHHHKIIHAIKDAGCKAGVSINPSTNFENLFSIIEYLDLVLIMSVNPGFGGQKFIESSLRKIEAAAVFKSKHSLNFAVEVDGGVDKNNIRKISDAGCEVFVAGSSIFHSENISAATSELKNLVSKK